MNQGIYEDRSIEDTLGISYDLMSMLPEGDMKRLKTDFIKKYGKWNKEE